MRAERRSPVAPAALAAAVLAAIVAALGVWSWLPGPPPPPPAAAVGTHDAAGRAVGGAAEVAPDAAVPAPDAGPGPGERPARAEVEPPRTAVIGTALDAGGGPLSGFSVLLQCTDPLPSRTTLSSGPGPFVEVREQSGGPRPAVVGAIDAAGAFAFEGLEGGNYKCRIVGLEPYGEEFALAPGEVRELTLRSPLVALTGTLYRAAAVAKDCMAAFDDGATRRTAPLPDQADGTIRSFAAPGRYDVFIHLATRAHREQGLGPCLSRHVLLVPEGVPALRWRFETGGTALTVRLNDASGKAIEVFTIVVEGTAACDQRSASYFVAGERGRGAVVPVLPDGQWRVAVNGANVIVAARELTTDGALPHQEMTFVAEPAVTVKLVLRTRAGAPFTPPLSLLPPLRAAGCEVKCIAPTSRASAAVGTREFRVDYANVPFGPAELRFEDRAEGDEHLMLPFEPLPPVRVDVTGSGINEVVLIVEPRVRVDLRGCDQLGMEEPQAVVTVWAAGRGVRGQEAVASQRWRGWLPRGTYRVTVDRGGVCREHTLHVDHEPVSLRYRP